MNGLRLLRHLCGVWHFTRRIAPGARMRGRAVFQCSAPDRLDYREDGTLQLQNGDSFASHRAFRYAAEDETLAVYFADGGNRGQLFHRLPCAALPVLHGQHRCGSDLYRSRYRFISPDAFILTHSVQGPRKAYASATLFHRFTA